MTQHFKFGVVFCSTKFNNPYSYIPDNATFDENINETLEKYVAWLKDKFEKDKKLQPNFIIFDDVLGELQNDKTFKNLVSTYRHYLSIIFVASQHVQYITPLMREQIVYAFCFSMSTELARKNVWKAIGQSRNPDEFYAIMDSCTHEKHRTLFYNAEADDEEERFLTFKAPAETSTGKYKF
jgi:hypothetical protein